MMYPKKAAGSQKASSTTSRKFLNPTQREDLKKVVAERLSKKYGLKYTDIIRDEVDQFMDQNKNITAAGLKDLENNVQKATQPKYQNNKQGYQDQEDNLSVKSGISKMSGASNFDKVDLHTSKTLTKAEKEEHAKYKDKKLQTMNVQTAKNDLDFLEEEDEWAAIYKYNKYLFDKEEQAKQAKIRDQKVALKNDLDNQVVEKQMIKQGKLIQDDKYAQNMHIQMDRYDQREKEKAEEVQRLKDIERHARERQIKENKYRRRHQDKQEKALDNYLMQKVREELEQEQKYTQFKKEHQAEVMTKLLAENEERKKFTEQQERDEKNENIKLMNAYAKLISDQDEEREKTLKERDAKMKLFQAKALETVAQEHEDKLGKMEQRRDRYERRHEQKLDEQEEKTKQQLAQQKKDMKAYLFKQMDEKQQRKTSEKSEYNSQADIWKKDNMKYAEYESNRNNKKREIMTTYAQTLKSQMSANQDAKKQNTSKMNENEAFLNKFLLDELDSIKQEKDRMSQTQY